MKTIYTITALIATLLLPPSLSLATSKSHSHNRMRTTKTNHVRPHSGQSTADSFAATLNLGDPSIPWNATGIADYFNDLNYDIMAQPNPSFVGFLGKNTFVSAVHPAAGITTIDFWDVNNPHIVRHISCPKWISSSALTLLPKFNKIVAMTNEEEYREPPYPLAHHVYLLDVKTGAVDRDFNLGNGVVPLWATALQSDPDRLLLVCRSASTSEVLFYSLIIQSGMILQTGKSDVLQNMFVSESDLFALSPREDLIIGIKSQGQYDSIPGNGVIFVYDIRTNRMARERHLKYPLSAGGLHFVDPDTLLTKNAIYNIQTDQVQPLPESVGEGCTFIAGVPKHPHFAIFHYSGQSGVQLDPNNESLQLRDTRTYKIVHEWRTNGSHAKRVYVSDSSPAMFVFFERYQSGDECRKYPFDPAWLKEAAATH